jgi:hypothetical protein
VSVNCQAECVEDDCHRDEHVERPVDAYNEKYSVDGVSVGTFARICLDGAFVNEGVVFVIQFLCQLICDGIFLRFFHAALDLVNNFV